LTKRGLPRREHEIQCCFAELPDSFDAYVKGLKPRVRSKIRQSLRNSEEAGATFHWCDDPKALQEHLTGLFHLHGVRWRAAGIPGCFVSEQRQRFYRNLSAHLLGAGTLRFARLDIGGKPIAYQIGAVANHTYYQLQEGFDTGYSNLRVGTSLRAQMIRGLIDGGVRKYDFMADGSQHKSEWGSQGTRSFTVAFALPRVRARIAYSLREILDRRRERRPALAAEPADVSRESE
jgi:CelD/BcsL family acetyltransferase involved in cellulose biosynthesis